MVDTYMCWSGSVSSCSFSPLHYQGISPHVAIFSLRGTKCCLRAQNTGVKKEAQMVLRNTSSRRFLVWCREYFVLQNSSNCCTTATFAFSCHPRMLAFNALSIFMWNCSADLSPRHLLHPPLSPPRSLHVVNPALSTVWTVKRHCMFSQELHVPIFSFCSTVSVFCSEMMNSKNFKVVLTMLHHNSEIICALKCYRFYLAAVKEMHTQMHSDDYTEKWVQ